MINLLDARVNGLVSSVYGDRSGYTPVDKQELELTTLQLTTFH